MEFFAKNGDLYMNNQVIYLRGINWFGPETDARCVHALWQQKLDTYINILKQQDFNSVRITLSAETMLGLDTLKVSAVNSSLNPGMDTMTPGQIMDVVVKKLQVAGILVMFNMHRMKPEEDISELWYTADYPESKVIQAWEKLTLRYKNFTNVFAMDIKNEPHGRSAWGGGNDVNWPAACERIGNAIHRINPKVMICVAGVTMDIWGDSVDGARTRPVILRIPNKVFYSPHFYIHWRYPNKEGYQNKPYFDKCMGNLAKLGKETIVIGEYGYDHTNPLDTQWIKDFGNYCKSIGVQNAFFWCLNANGAFNHSILDKDWKTLIPGKTDIIKFITPKATDFNFSPSTPPPSPTRPVTPPPRPVTPSPRPVTPSPRPVTPPPRPVTPRPQPPNTPLRPLPSLPTVQITDLEIRVTQKNQWKEGNNTIYHQEVIIINKSNKTIKNINIEVNGTQIQSSYSATQNGLKFSFPSWLITNKLAPQQQWIFGFKSINSFGKVIVRNHQFV
jgi:endoglucanase